MHHPTDKDVIPSDSGDCGRYQAVGGPQDDGYEEGESEADPDVPAAENRHGPVDRYGEEHCGRSTGEIEDERPERRDRAHQSGCLAREHLTAVMGLDLFGLVGCCHLVSSL